MDDFVKRRFWDIELKLDRIIATLDEIQAERPWFQFVTPASRSECNCHLASNTTAAWQCPVHGDMSTANATLTR